MQRFWRLFFLVVAVMLLMLPGPNRINRINANATSNLVCTGGCVESMVTSYNCSSVEAQRCLDEYSDPQEPRLWSAKDCCEPVCGGSGGSGPHPWWNCASDYPGYEGQCVGPHGETSCDGPCDMGSGCAWVYE